MYSPLGQVVGLIEIECRSGGPDAIAPLDVPADAPLDDASLGELLARLAGRYRARSGQMIAASEAPGRPTNRLAMSAPLPLTRIEANLAQLAADLADQTDRLRQLIAAA